MFINNESSVILFMCVMFQLDKGNLLNLNEYILSDIYPYLQFQRTFSEDHSVQILVKLV